MNHVDQVNELSNDEGEASEGLLSMENVDHHHLGSLSANVDHEA
jgi:hypothetical protein